MHNDQGLPQWANISGAFPLVQEERWDGILLGAPVVKNNKTPIKSNRYKITNNNNELYIIDFIDYFIRVMTIQAIG